MMMRGVILAVILCILLAGCTGFGGSESVTPTDTTDSVETDPRDTSTPNEQNPPPNVTDLPFTEAESLNTTHLLIEYHIPALQSSEGYAAIDEIRFDEPTDTGVIERVVTMRANIAKQRAQWVTNFTTEDGETVQDTVIYFNNESLFRWWVKDGENATEEPMNREFSAVAATMSMDDTTLEIFANIEMTADKTVTSDSEVRYYFTGDSFIDDPSQGIGENPVLHSATVVIDDDGIIRSFEAEYTQDAPDGDGTILTSASFEIETIGPVEVEVPSWVRDEG